MGTVVWPLFVLEEEEDENVLLLLEVLVVIDLKLGVVDFLALSTWSYETNLLSFVVVVNFVDAVVVVAALMLLATFTLGGFDTCMVFFIDCICIGFRFDDDDDDDDEKDDVMADVAIDGGPGPLCWFKFIIITVDKRVPARLSFARTLPF